MLNLGDLVTLAKQGFTPDKVKELIELSKTEEAAEAPAEVQTQPSIEPEAEEQQPEEKPKEVEKKDAEPSADTVDYKKKVEELEAKIQLLQKENTRRNADTDNKKSDAEMFAETMRSFM